MAKKGDSLKDELAAQAEAAKVAQAEALLVDVCDDEHRGMGGSFIYDPVTKTRKRATVGALPLAADPINEPDADNQGE